VENDNKAPELDGLVPLSDEEKKKIAHVFPQSLRDAAANKREDVNEADALLKEHQLRETLIEMHGLAVATYGVENVPVELLKRLELACKLGIMTEESLRLQYEYELAACMKEKKQ
jgi:hypothetical protein